MSAYIALATTANPNSQGASGRQIKYDAIINLTHPYSQWILCVNFNTNEVAETDWYTEHHTVLLNADDETSISLQSSENSIDRHVLMGNISQEQKQILSKYLQKTMYGNNT